jgi:hypothetical protein
LILPCGLTTALPLAIPDGRFIRGTDQSGRLGDFVTTQNTSYEVFSNSSLYNEEVALTKRLLRNVEEEYQEDLFQEAITHLMGKAKQLNPMKKEQLLDCYSGSKLKRYQAAVLNLAQTPLVKGDFRIQSFVKKERTNDLSKYPRMVHHRNYEAIFEMLRYVKPLEHKLYKMKFNVNGFQSRGPVVAKGLNGNLRASLIIDKMNQFENPCVLSLDCSSFELHVAEGYLQFENKFMCAHYAQDCYFRWMTSNIISHRGRTSNGQKWSRRGGRVSGDAHTGYGNTLAMILCMTQFAYDFPQTKFDILSDGDDTLMFFETGNVNFNQVQEHFTHFGHELRLDNIAYSFEEVLFCQHRFSGEVMIRNPETIILKALTAISQQARQDPRSYYAGIGKGLRATYGVIPELKYSIDMLVSLDPDALPSYDYWLQKPQIGSLDAGIIYDFFDFDQEFIDLEVQSLVLALQ